MASLKSAPKETMLDSDYEIKTPQYPLYLDVPMMIAFLAALDDGVAYEKSVMRRTRGTKGSETAGHGKIGGGVFSDVAGIDIGGNRTGKSEAEESEETQLSKLHTEASLFNQLRNRLYEKKLVQSIGVSKEDLGLVESGMIVEVNGVVLPNPLEELVELMSRLHPFIKGSTTPNTQPNQSSSQRGARNQQSNASATSASRAAKDSPKTADPLILIDLIREDLDASRMTDILLKADSITFPKVVLTVKKDFGTEVGRDGLVGAQVGVIGKVSTIAANLSDSPIQMMRRSALRVMPAEQMKAMFAGLSTILGDESPQDRIVIEPPLIQIMPLAIFL